MSLNTNHTISSYNLSNGKQMQFNLNEALIPLEELVNMFNEQDKAGISPTLFINPNSGRNKTLKSGSSNHGGTREKKKGLMGRAQFRKRTLTPPPKLRSNPIKRSKYEEIGMHAAIECVNLEKAEAGSDQPHHSS